MTNLFTAIGIVVITLLVVAFLASYCVMCSEVFSLGSKLDKVINELESKKPKKEKEK